MKFIFKKFPDEYKKLKETKIQVLHWQKFEATNKKSTIVFRLKTKTEEWSNKDSKIIHDYVVKEDEPVVIYSKGAPEILQ